MSRTTDILLTALAPAVWGSTYLVTTEALPAGYPVTLAALRALPAGLLLLAAHALPAAPCLARARLPARQFQLRAVLGAVVRGRLPASRRGCGDAGIAAGHDGDLHGARVARHADPGGRGRRSGHRRSGRGAAADLAGRRPRPHRHRRRPRWRRVHGRRHGPQPEMAAARFGPQLHGLAADGRGFDPVATGADHRTRAAAAYGDEPGRACSGSGSSVLRPPMCSGSGVSPASNPARSRCSA